MLTWITGYVRVTYLSSSKVACVHTYIRTYIYTYGLIYTCCTCFILYEDLMLELKFVVLILNYSREVRERGSKNTAFICV